MTKHQWGEHEEITQAEGANTLCEEAIKIFIKFILDLIFCRLNNYASRVQKIIYKKFFNKKITEIINKTMLPSMDFCFNI